MPAFGGDNCVGVATETADCDSGTLCPGELRYRLFRQMMNI